MTRNLVMIDDRLPSPVNVHTVPTGDGVTPTLTSILSMAASLQNPTLQVAKVQRHFFSLQMIMAMRTLRMIDRL